MNPLISVVIPVYNAEESIVMTLDSVVNQTYKNFEIVLVDDGSKDRSNVLMQQYIKDHPDVKIKLVTKQNGGVSSARNAGIDNSTGTFICFLDSDDQWLPKKLEVQIDIMLQNPDIGVLGTNMNDMRFKKMFGVTFSRLTPITSRMILMKNFLCIQTTMIRKEVLDDIGYFVTDQDNEDSNMIIRIANKYKAYLLNEPFVIYGNGKPLYGESGLNSRLWEMEKGELKNVATAVKMKIIKPYEYPFYTGFSLAKYFRRVLVVFFRNLKLGKVG